MEIIIILEEQNFQKFILNKFPIYSIGFAISAIFEISMRTHYNFSPVEISFFFYKPIIRRRCNKVRGDEAIVLSRR